MTRQKILDAAARLFSQRGFGNTPTSLLAREAGISEGSIYRHFSSKDEIFLHLISEVRTELESTMEEALAQARCQSGLERISCALEVYSEFVRDNHKCFALIFRDAPTRAGHGDSVVQDELRAIHDYILNIIHEGLLRGVKEKSVRGDVDLPTMAAMICSMILGMTRMRFFGFLTDEQVGPLDVRENLERLLQYHE